RTASRGSEELLCAALRLLRALCAQATSQNVGSGSSGPDGASSAPSAPTPRFDEAVDRLRRLLTALVAPIETPRGSAPAAAATPAVQLLAAQVLVAGLPVLFPTWRQRLALWSWAAGLARSTGSSATASAGPLMLSKTGPSSASGSAAATAAT